MNEPTITSQVEQLSHGWAAAERSGDAGALDKLAVSDFMLVGPLGFILDRSQWLDRFRTGELTISELSWEDLTVRSYESAAVIIGTYSQKAAYRGQPNDGAFRVSQTWVRADDGWRLAGIHFSPITAPPRPPAQPS